MRVESLVSSVMSCPVVVVEPTSQVSEVMALANTCGIHHFPIVEEGMLVGLVCTCDLRDAIPSTPVMAFGRRPVVVVAESSTIPDAARAMAESAVGSAVVLDGDGVVGIVTRSDLRGAGPEYAALVADARCSACGEQHHLKPGPDGSALCVDCHDRSRGEDWFDTGVGD